MIYFKNISIGIKKYSNNKQYLPFIPSFIYTAQINHIKKLCSNVCYGQFFKNMFWFLRKFYKIYYDE